ncbi:FAD-dependent monooxygenase [Romeria aff. gracilis LEGE 07310]|uniref:FAD-dependent monooxygenase n=1 Tax=Vasconcelosia minhoensis LEGE 07310 TaxID=915328 RepID=A0A8J7DCK1_9CYAN|nr:FAD-dependent monooxygenase [Romeria gracilis]MBE9077768.1 FAD-dependent monooxygenase [Romeria aff. gracilis LEGE 07310]
MPVKSKEPCVIVGAGPTGLAAALLLAKRGTKSRIVEKRLEPSAHSKAFGVNPRTLELLEGTGVTERLLEHGRRMQALNLWRKGDRLFHLDLSKVRHRFPFMLIYSQAKTEALLAETLTDLGGEVERGVEFLSLNDEQTRCLSRLRHANGREEEITTSVILGADGPSSTVRKTLDIPFDGSDYDNDWYLYDVELETSLNADEAHVFLLNDGAMFMVRIEDNVWRVLGNVSELLGRLPRGSSPGNVVWESDFNIAHRIAQRFQQGCAYLGGDAAHIHSGLGARGMNLGIEDAYVFAELTAVDQLSRYHDLRHGTDYRVLRQVQRMTEVPKGKSAFSQVVRRVAPLIAPFLPLGASKMRKWILGLEHEVIATNGS